MPADPALLTISQAAKYLGVSSDTLRRWERKGKLIPQRTLGNARRYRIEDVNRLKNKYSQPSTIEVLNQTKAEINQLKQDLKQQQKEIVSTPTQNLTGQN